MSTSLVDDEYVIVDNDDDNKATGKLVDGEVIYYSFDYYNNKDRSSVITMTKFNDNNK